MPNEFTYDFDTELYKGSVTLNTGLFINNEFVDPVDPETIDVFNPSTGDLITSVAGASAKDVDLAVEAASKAYKTSWGLKVPGAERGRLMNKLADLLEKHAEPLVALDSLNVGHPFALMQQSFGNYVSHMRFYAGFAGKLTGDTVESNEDKFTYTRREPYGVVGQIIPWNGPMFGLVTKLGPALAAGNTVVLKPSEVTPLSACYFAALIKEAGFPPGVINFVTGYGQKAGQRIAEHPNIWKVAFTGSTLTGRKIQEASAKSNLKVVTLELGGKSPNIIFDDADIEQAVKWASLGFLANAGQACCGGTRIFVQEGIYDAFLDAMTKSAQFWNSVTGDPFSSKTMMGPIVSKVQIDRVLSYIDSGKKDGAKVHVGGTQAGDKGYFVQPTIFTETKPEMKIVKEEIFGPVAVLVKFKTEEEVIEWANDTTYGLACGVFTQNVSRAIRVSNAIEAGSAWVNCYHSFENMMPFGGYKQSGIGKEYGSEAVYAYTRVKGVHINIGQML